MVSTETSREAFYTLPVIGYLQPKEAQVLAAFNRPETMLTRQQLADALGWGINVVCGRVNSLLTKHVLAVRGSRIDPATHKRQELIGLPVTPQSVLF